MKITDVEITNFLTIGDTVKINLDNRGMVLITGDNRDDTSAISNGAGKSTIGDAICWGLYGVTARGETGDDIVNNIVGKNCSVIQTLDDEGVLYKVHRYRKNTVHKNSLQIHTINAAGLLDKCLTKGTDKLSQDLLNKIIGCSIEVFKSAIYAGQDSIPNLPGMTDKNLKEIVEEAAGINRLGEAYAIARDELKYKESHVVATLTKLDAIRLDMVTSDASLSLYNTKGNDFASVISGKVADLHKRDSALRADAALVHAEADWKIDKAVELVKVKVLDDDLAKFFAAKKEVDATKDKCFKALNITETLFKASLAKVKGDTVRLASIEDRIGKPCGECGKDYCEEDLESATKIAKQELTKSKRAAIALRETKGDDEAAFLSASQAVNLVGDSATAVKQNKAATGAINAGIDRLTRLQSYLDEITTEIASNAAKVHDLIVEDNPYAELINDTTIALVIMRADEVVLAERYFDAIEARDLAIDAVKVFSPAGVRAHVIDTVTPYLNDRTAHYLSILSDGNISAVWNTLSKTKTGELREKFVIEVSNDKGAKKFGGLSGGEKRKVRIATALALQDLVASRASKPFLLFVADEIDDALDVAGLERLMMLLEEKSREKGTVLMISHNEISDWCREQTVIIKEGGFSRVEGALVL